MSAETSSVVIPEIFEAFNSLNAASKDFVRRALVLIKELLARNNQSFCIGKYVTFPRSENKRFFIFDQAFNSIYGGADMRKMFKDAGPSTRNPYHTFIHKYKIVTSQWVLCACHKMSYISNDTELKISLDDQFLADFDNLEDHGIANLENYLELYYKLRTFTRGDSINPFSYECNMNYRMQLILW